MSDEKKQVQLKIDELEERIAPHFHPLGGGNAAVEFNAHGGPRLELPNGNVQPVPGAAEDGLLRAVQGGN